MQEPQTAAQILRRPEITLGDVHRLCPPLEPLGFETTEQVEIRTKYMGYFERQQRDIEKFMASEELAMPEGLDYRAIPGLPRESQDKLERVRPVNLGQAARISGVRPSDIAALHIYLSKQMRQAELAGH